MAIRRKPVFFARSTQMEAAVDWEVVGLGLFAATFWGVANYFGGVVGRQVGAQRGALATQISVFAVLLPLSFLIPHTWSGSVLGWGVLASFGGIVGFVAMYAGMNTGSMGVVTKLISGAMILVPFGIGLAQGERPSALVLLGVSLVLVSIFVLSLQPKTRSEKHTHTDRRAVALGLLSGIGFGFATAAQGQTEVGDGSVVLLAYRAMIALMLLGGLLAMRESLRFPRSSWKGIGLSGLFSGIGDTAWIVALQRGDLSVVPALVAMHPAVTALAARFFGAERIRAVQVAGIVIGLSDIAMIKI
jgi:drug/metabolite transporter (DMT)-like permease